MNPEYYSIEKSIETFGKAAERTKRTGDPDAFEILGAHGHLILQFLRDMTNKKNDEFEIFLLNSLGAAKDPVKKLRKEG